MPIKQIEEKKEEFPIEMPQKEKKSRAFIESDIFDFSELQKTVPEINKQESVASAEKSVKSSVSSNKPRKSELSEDDMGGFF